jgi:solute carrier family 25, member 39/40
MLKKKINENYVPLFAGSLSRVLSAFISTPFELIRTTIQSKVEEKKVHVIVSEIIKKKGVRGMWKGLAPTVIRDVPFSALYWFLYEGIQKKLKVDRNKFEFIKFFVSGATAGENFFFNIPGMIAAFITTPIDVIKTRIQSQNENVIIVN